MERKGGYQKEKRMIKGLRDEDGRSRSRTRFDDKILDLVKERNTNDGERRGGK